MRKGGKRLDGRERNQANTATELQKAADLMGDYDKLKDSNERLADEKIRMAIDKYSHLIGELTVAVGGGGVGTTQVADPDLVEAHYKRAEAFMKIGRYNSALTDLYQTLNGQPKPMHYKLLARCNQELKNITEALDNYKDALAIANTVEKAQIYLERGQLFSKQGEYQAAIKDFNDAIKCMGEKIFLPSLFLERGRCYRQIEEYKLSITDLEKAVEIYQKRPESIECALSYNDLGLSYYESGDFDRAFQQFSNAVELKPENSVFYNNRGLANTHLDNLEAAMNDFNLAVKLKPDDPRSYYNRGDVYCSMSKYKQAHKDYDKAINLEPENCTFYHAKALCYEQEDEHWNAKEFYKKALSIDPSHLPSIFHLGLMQHKLRELTDALESFSQVILFNQDNEERLAYESRGLIYMDMKNYVKAIEDFDKASNLEPDYASVYYFRGLSKIERRLYHDAIEDFQKAQELNSQNPGIFSGLGQAYKELGDYEKALYV